MSEELFYILDTRTIVGNCALWWRPNGEGYTCNLDDAGIWTAATAPSGRPTDVRVRRDVAEALSKRHVHIDTVRAVINSVRESSPASEL
jgi:hypothetical protein